MIKDHRHDSTCERDKEHQVLSEGEKKSRRKNEEKCQCAVEEATLEAVDLLKSVGKEVTLEKAVNFMVPTERQKNDFSSTSFYLHSS